MNLLQWIAIIVLAATPVFIWAYLLLRRTKEDGRLMFMAFLWGAFATAPLLIYRFLWEIYPSLDLFHGLKNIVAGSSIAVGPLLRVPLDIIIAFLLIGFFEELLKSLVLRYKVDKKEIDKRNDAIEYSIAIALGFAFVENISYFAQAYTNFNSQILINILISRTIFATFAHILFSGIFGYYYGTAVLAKQAFRDSNAWQIRSIKWLKSKIPKLHDIELFQKEELVIGLTHAALAHAIYNIFLELQFTPFLIPFLVFGVVELHRLRRLKR